MTVIFLLETYGTTAHVILKIRLFSNHNFWTFHYCQHPQFWNSTEKLIPICQYLLTYLNLVWINDESNVIAAEAIEVGLEEPPVGVKVVGLEKMSTDTTEVVSAIEQLCGKLGAMIDAGTPPDVIIDSTRHCGRNFQNFVQKSLISANI